ncbi:MAG: HEPN domain-containing protein [Sedimentisphaerales bacterium]|jgi:hypothetical protein
MPYERIEYAIKVCVEYLNKCDKTSPDLPEIESRIVSGLVVLIVSEYEERIENTFIKRAEQCGDNAVSTYIRNILAEKFRSPDIGKITETLGRFGGTFKESFSKTVLNTESHAAWDNIMRARHAVVHKKGTLNLTLRELEGDYPKTKYVISQLEAVLLG